ncbi:GIY-YIG nuclease family protein [Candidatus Dependentiae bacterium]
MQSFYVYILECSDRSYYTGHTDNLETRFEQHVLSETNSYTSSRKPLKLVYSEVFGDRDYAKQAEKQIKGWSRAKKKALINQDFNLLRELSKSKSKK